MTFISKGTSIPSGRKKSTQVKKENQDKVNTLDNFLLSPNSGLYITKSVEIKEEEPLMPLSTMLTTKVNKRILYQRSKGNFKV